MKFVPKPKSIMGDWIAVHSRVVHCPIQFKHIPWGTVWIREDIWNSPVRRYHTIKHEELEYHYMEDLKLSYPEAHRRANLIWG